MIHKGIDGQLVNLERTPLQAETLRKIAEIKAATGWVPVRVGPWYYRCQRCAKLTLGYECPVCYGQVAMHSRFVLYHSWWRPWTWWRPKLRENFSPSAVVSDIEEIPTHDGAADGRLSLPFTGDP